MVCATNEGRASRRGCQSRARKSIHPVMTRKISNLAFGQRFQGFDLVTPKRFVTQRAGKKHKRYLFRRKESPFTPSFASRVNAPVAGVCRRLAGR